jgi:hypothetical protein
VYVPLSVIVLTFEGASTPRRWRCQPWLWRLALPITSNGSPYSMLVQVLLKVTGVPPEVHV